MPVTASEYMTDQFIRLSTNNSLVDAISAFQAEPGKLAVLQHDNRGVTIIAFEDIKKLQERHAVNFMPLLSLLPPGIALHPEVPLEEFVKFPAYAAFNMGARGVIIVSDEETTEIQGILSIDAVKRFLASTGIEPHVRTPRDGDASFVLLPGSIRTGKLIMFCDEFGHRNELTFYNRRKGQECQDKEPHPHLIRRK